MKCAFIVATPVFGERTCSRWLLLFTAARTELHGHLPDALWSVAGFTLTHRNTHGRVVCHVEIHYGDIKSASIHYSVSAVSRKTLWRGTQFYCTRSYAYNMQCESRRQIDSGSIVQEHMLGSYKITALAGEVD